MSSCGSSQIFFLNFAKGAVTVEFNWLIGSALQLKPSAFSGWSETCKSYEGNEERDSGQHMWNKDSKSIKAIHGAPPRETARVWFDFLAIQTREADPNAQSNGDEFNCDLCQWAVNFLST